MEDGSRTGIEPKQKEQENMKTVSARISENLALTMVELGGVVVKQERQPTNHVLIIDCSGSMYGELPEIRNQIKKKVPKLLEEEDTISVIWFSGRGQFGSLIRAEKVSGPQNLLEIEKAVDRWLKPVGLTGFKEPLEEAARIADECKKKSPKGSLSLWFMSDGCDNEWGRTEILRATKALADKFDSCVFVEYGYYADRPTMTEMAKASGGALIFSSDFNQYNIKFEERLRTNIKSVNKIEGDAGVKEKYDFGFYRDNGEIFTFEVNEGKFSVPESVNQVFLLSEINGREKWDMTEVSAKVFAGKGTEEQKNLLLGAYGALAQLSQRAKSKDIYQALRPIGDVDFILAFSKTFGKDKYSEFTEKSRQVFLGTTAPYSAGRNTKAVPKEDAFNSLTLLEILSSSENNYLLLGHPDFSYNRISRARIDSNLAITKEDSEQIQEITTKLSTCKVAAEARVLQEELNQLLAKKQALKFVPNDDAGEVPIRSLTFNRTQPNVSLLVQRKGSVDISSKVPSNLRTPLVDAVANNFSTFTFRNYSIISNGMGNVKNLPVKVDKKTYDKLMESGMEANSLKSVQEIDNGENFVMVIRMDTMPTINQKMITEASAKSLCEVEVELLDAQAANKVFGFYKKEEEVSKKSEYEQRFGKEFSDWLKSEGITSYSGFSPKSVQADSTDFIMVKELEVKVKGSTLPKVQDVIDGKSKSAGAKLMQEYIKEVEEFKSTLDGKDTTKKFKEFLEKKSDFHKERSRRLILEAAKMKFAVIVGQTWFTEFRSMDENTMEVEFEGETYKCTLELGEKKVNI